jgi:hypothetical protein
MVEAESSQEHQPDEHNNFQQPSQLYEQDEDEDDIVAPPSSFYSQNPFCS